MLIGEKLLNQRKKAGLSQEELAEKLQVSRQTISKWETGQTQPELEKLQLVGKLYNVSYDYLVSDTEISGDITSIEHIVDEIDWTAAWSKKYPILASYQAVEGIEKYRQRISDIYDAFINEFLMNDTDTVLVLKDILYQKFKNEKAKRKK